LTDSLNALIMSWEWFSLRAEWNAFRVKNLALNEGFLELFYQKFSKDSGVLKGNLCSCMLFK